MAPAKGSKRVASTAPAAVAKEAKKPKVDARVSGIVGVLEKAELPESCRAMLMTLTQSLLTPRDARHELQSTCVAMVEETLQEAKSKLLAAISSSQARLSELEGSKGALVARVEEALSASTARTETKKAAKEALNDAISGVSAAKTALEEKEAASTQVETDLASANTDKTAAEGLVAEHFRAPFDAGEGPHYSFLKDTVAKLGLDESFTNALPSSCVKTKEQRGQFDDLVLGELEKALERHLAALAAAATAATAAVPATAQAVETAAAQLREAEAAKEVAAKALSDAEELAEKAAEDLDEAKKASEAVEPSIIEVTNGNAALKAELEELEKGPLANFAELRDKVSLTPAEEAAPAGA